jgi:hypothetical protein
MTTTLSRLAALAHLRQQGLSPDEAQAALAKVPVAACWNDGFGRTAYYYEKDLPAAPSDPCEACDGEGNVWNNADPTSGQRVDCEVCK